MEVRAKLAAGSVAAAPRNQPPLLERLGRHLRDSRWHEHPPWAEREEVGTDELLLLAVLSWNTRHPDNCIAVYMCSNIPSAAQPMSTASSKDTGSAPPRVDTKRMARMG